MGFCHDGNMPASHDGDGDDDAGSDGSKIEGSRREGAKRGSVPPNPGG